MALLQNDTTNVTCIWIVPGIVLTVLANNESCYRIDFQVNVCLSLFFYTGILIMFYCVLYNDCNEGYSDEGYKF